MNDFIDNYCERFGPGLWAEPLNALTNFAFFIAAFCAYQLARKENVLRPDTALLIGLVALIGLGSLAFHTVATFWAMLADSLPILIYQIIFLHFYGRHVMGLGCRKNAVLLASFLLAIYCFGRLPPDWLNGSLQYAPAFIFVGGLGVYHALSRKNESLSLVLAAGIFAISLSFRSLDMALCEYIPIGVHFIWHCLNALVLYITARSYILNIAPQHKNSGLAR